LLSKHKILSSEHVALDATTNRRGVHHAVIQSPAGKVDVYCTHLSAVFSLLPYPKDEGDWDVEQRAQAVSLLNLVNSTAKTDKVVVVGDFNSGPAIGDDVNSVEIDTYNIFTGANYSDPYAEVAGQCTWCADNPLISDGVNADLDHVFVKGFEGAPTAKRVLDGPESIEVCAESADGSLSDHYGISVTLTP